MDGWRRRSQSSSARPLDHASSRAGGRYREEPARSLARDLDIPWRLNPRTGDTKAVRARAAGEAPPTALVTTPESLALLPGARRRATRQFSHLHLIVVDEWHELMGTKRGVLTELELARLRHWNPDARTWGLSATLGNLDTRRGDSSGQHCSAAHASCAAWFPSPYVIDSLVPPSTWTASHGPATSASTCCRRCSRRSRKARPRWSSPTLARRREIWYQAILDARPDWAGTIALHHGSLERKLRDWVEDGLRSGTLRCVVCTSSFDLGVDFTPVDRVIQIGSPKGVARLLQRAGRSGHRPGVPSRITCAPTHAFELVEVAAARDAYLAGAIESRYPR